MRGYRWWLWRQILPQFDSNILQSHDQDVAALLPASDGIGTTDRRRCPNKQKDKKTSEGEGRYSVSPYNVKS
jgi:hypothetical protein